MTISRGKRTIDIITFCLFLSLTGLGLLFLYTVSYDQASVNFWQSAVGKQAIWVGICLVAFLFIQLIDWKFWETFAYGLYGLSMVLLVGVLLVGSTIKGATSWYTFGGFSLQPSELAKFGTALAVAAYLSTFNANLKLFKSQLIAFGFLAPPMGLILLQPDAGSALVFTSFLVVFFRAGLSSSFYIVGAFVALIGVLGLVIDPSYIIGGLLLLALLALAFQFAKPLRWMVALIVLPIAILWGIGSEAWPYLLGGGVLALVGFAWQVMRLRQPRLAMLMPSMVAFGALLAFGTNYAFNNILKPHQQDRINVWLQPSKCDPRGSLYNVMQSKMAISSGGLEGKGFLEGTMTKLNYVPEQRTDFIFCTVGEEQGFVGVVLVIALFTYLLYRLTVLAERQRSAFSRYYIYAVAGMLFFHVFINIGMTMGLFPIIGIPLPFISKGGSSLLGFTLMIAVALQLDSHRYQF